MSSDEERPLNEIIRSVVGERTRFVDPEDLDTTWEVGFLLEGVVFDAIWERLPKGYSRDLIEQVLGLVDWERVVERTTWELAEDEEALP